MFVGKALAVDRFEKAGSASDVRATLEVLDGQKGVTTGQMSRPGVGVILRRADFHSTAAASTSSMLVGPKVAAS